MTGVRVTLITEVRDELGNVMTSVTNTTKRTVLGNQRFVVEAAEDAADEACKITAGMLTDRFGDGRSA